MNDCLPASEIRRSWNLNGFSRDQEASQFSLKNTWNTQELRHSVQFSSVQSLSRVRLFATPWITARQASLSITNSWSSLRLTSIESVMPSSHLILSRPLLLLPPIPPSVRVFSNKSTLHWSFSFSIIPSEEHPGLISFRMDWLDLLAVQGTLKSLLQHHSSKASILQCSAFFFLFPLKLCQTLFFWAPKSLQMVTSAVTLKDAYSLEEKLWPI